MKKVGFRSTAGVILAAFGVLAIAVSGCVTTATPEPEPTNSKVIVTHAGEVTQDTKAVGEPIEYRIYYVNGSGQQADVTIVDRLDSNLSSPNPSDGGTYDEAAHTVTWEIAGVGAGADGFVELGAVVVDGPSVLNRATIEVSGTTAVDTNNVETTVCGTPTLGWIPFDSVSKPGDPPRSNMKDETTSGVMVNFDIPGMFVDEVEIDGVAYHRLSIPGQANLVDVGQPALPIVGQVIEVPFGVDFSIEIYKSESIPLECYNVFPAQEQQIRDEGSGDGEFAIDPATYGTDALYPGDLAAVEAEDVGVIRGHRVVFLKVNPVQYNPVTREMEAYSNVEVRLNYDEPAQIQAVDERLESDAFEELLEALVLNYKEPSRFSTGASREEEKEGCEYLIITHGDFFNASDPNNPVVLLQQWKEQKGYTSCVVDVANIPGGSSAENIRDYIQGEYDSGNPAPTYVLLVGDADFVPTNYLTAHLDHGGSQIGSDLYYGTVDGSDYFPDIFVGRLSVDTLAEARDVVDKILRYEQQPPAAAAYYADTSLVCLFEDDDPPDGQEDDSFRIIEFAEEIRDYLDGEGYNPERIYDQSGTFAAGPQSYEDGTALPAELTLAGDPGAGIPGFPWNGSTADISAAINGGNFVVTYNGHGGRDGWSRPSFSTANANALANGNLTPVVFSVACQTGWFDNETDHVATNDNDDCFSEEFLRHGAGGAVAVIGSTRNSWQNNDFMMLGMYEAIWPDFDPNPPLDAGQLPAVETGPLYRMGQIHTFSKLYMASYYNHDFYRQSSFEMYTLFGDPEMMVWTEEPATLKVVHPEGIGASGEQDFVVSVTDDGSGDPVQGAVVSLTRDGSLIVVDETNAGGLARFTLHAMGSGDLDITVTKHNYAPYIGSMEINAGGAVLNRLEPEDGTENQVIHVGGQSFDGAESVDIYLGDQLLETAVASAGSFGQSGVEDVDIQVPSPYALGPVNVVAHGLNSDRYAVDVFQVRTANPIDLYTYSQWDDTTWHLHAGDNPTWDNPEIQVYDGGGNPVASNNLGALVTYDFEVQVHNDTDFNAQGVKVTFKWADFGLGQPDRVWSDIDTVEIDVPAHMIREATVDWAPPSTGHLCVIAEIYHVEDIRESNNRGQENLHVGPTSSPAEVRFVIYNPTETPAAVYLELRQLIDPRDQESRLWASWIKHPDPQLLGPGEMTEAAVIIDPDPADVGAGAQAEFALTGFIGDQMIGGVNFVIVKGK